jgi:hypothetical protein
MPRNPGEALGVYPTQHNRWLRKPGEPRKTTLGFAVEDDILRWLIGQTHTERTSLSHIVRRAVRLEKRRVESLGKGVSPDEVDSELV